MLLHEISGFAPFGYKNIFFPNNHVRQTACQPPLHGSSDDDKAEIPQTYTTVETSAELSERFNYKVQALMGNFDPPPGVTDDERQDGNILNAMIQFPAKYTFNVVGKTLGGEKEQTEYAEAVKRVVQESTGDAELSCEIKPRGKKFTKVECEATVQSATMINMIYDELDEIDMTVMRF
jgi:putative lipoic acid-binding regulatory protein